MHDATVRSVVRRLLDNIHTGDRDTRIVEEMGVGSGSVRVDLAVINGQMAGFEIKSDRDTLARLARQAEVYSQVFDRVTLIVGARHREKASAAVPTWWGIYEAIPHGNSVAIHPTRAPQPNPRPDPFVIAKLLWRDEALEILACRELDRGWRSKTAPAIHRRLAESLPLDELRAEVRARLKARSDWLRKPIHHMADVSI